MGRCTYCGSVAPLDGACRCRGCGSPSNPGLGEKMLDVFGFSVLTPSTTTALVAHKEDECRQKWAWLLRGTESGGPG